MQHGPGGLDAMVIDSDVIESDVEIACWLKIRSEVPLNVEQFAVTSEWSTPSRGVNPKYKKVDIVG